MQTFKVICVALLCVAVIALPSDKMDCDGSCGHTTTDNGTEGPKLEWWENAVFYQIYPRSFKDSDGDGIGDIKGIIQELDYLQELGIDGAWLSPIFKSPMKDFGYDIEDFYDIDPMFGTIEDLEELFSEAKKRNIRIILDFVPNHSSDQHEWFKKSVKREGKYENYYIWADGKNGAGDDKNPPNNWVSNFHGSAWTFNKERGQWYYHCFVVEQPDLNYRNKDVVDQMIDVLDFWLVKGASGFRIDAVNHLFEYANLKDEPLSGQTNDTQSYDYTLHYHTKDLPEVYEMVYRFREVADKFQENKGGERPILMTEAYTNNTEFVKYFKSQDGKKLGSQMPFNFVLISDLTRYSSAEDFKNVIDEKIGSVPDGTRLNWVMGNHDKPRVGSRYGERRIDGLLTLVMTLPGIAVTYNGEEIGMLDNRAISYADTLDPAACNLGVSGDWLHRSRDPERTPFQWDGTKFAGFMPENATTKPWLPIHPNYQEVNVELQKGMSRSTLNFYKQLLTLRKQDTFAYGSFNSTVLKENVFAYVRALNKSDTYVVLINFGARDEILDIREVVENLPDELELVVAGTDSCYKQSDKLKTKEVTLEKYDALILKAADSGVGPSVIANIALIFGLLTVASIARFVF